MSIFDEMDDDKLAACKKFKVASRTVRKMLDYIAVLPEGATKGYCPKMAAEVKRTGGRQLYITTVGSSKVGKSSLSAVLMRGKGAFTRVPEITADMEHMCFYVWFSGALWQINLSDCSGQECRDGKDFDPIRNPFVRVRRDPMEPFGVVDGVLTLFDIGAKGTYRVQRRVLQLFERTLKGMDDALGVKTVRLSTEYTEEDLSKYRAAGTDLIPFVMVAHKSDDEKTRCNSLQPHLINLPEKKGIPIWSVSSWKGEAWRGGCSHISKGAQEIPYMKDGPLLEGKEEWKEVIYKGRNGVEEKVKEWNCDFFEPLLYIARKKSGNENLQLDPEQFVELPIKGTETFPMKDLQK